MDTQGPPKTVQRRFLVIMKLSKHKNGHYGSRKIKVTSIDTDLWYYFGRKSPPNTGGIVVKDDGISQYCGRYGGYLNFSTPLVAIFVLRKFHYD